MKASMTDIGILPIIFMGKKIFSIYFADYKKSINFAG